MVVGVNAQKRKPVKRQAHRTSVRRSVANGTNFIGVNASYATDFNGLGLGVKVNHEFPKHFRAELSSDYFFKHDYVSFWDLNANLHYLFPVGHNITVYPLGGLTLANYHVSIPAPMGGADITENSTHFGVNIGGGAQYDINKDWSVNAEMKYRIISDYDQAVFTIGIAHRF